MDIHRVLFVCQGNVGRSQMAEGFYNRLGGGGIAVSAGVADVAEKYGGHPTQEIVAVMIEEGIDVSQHSIKQLTREMVDTASLVVVLCDPAICPEFISVGDRRVMFRRVPDPYQADLGATREIRDHIKALVLELIRSEPNCSF